ncbi:MAG: ABC transporter ATP-binding protein, partial [Micrococcales bacterium]|nr:ABC transporter ATP-binding protein [Micrococcales bacterium]
GSGKSTLMNNLGCLDVPDAGTYHLDGAPVGQLAEGRLAYLRSRSLGFVFQSYNLLPRLTALANVELPMAYAGVERAERRKRAIAALEMLSLVDRAGHRPAQLSGGQAQRVAVARALVNTPAVILADEPTGNLDSASAAEVLDALAAVNRRGRTVLLITHDAAVAKRADRCITLFDGRVATDSGSKT